MCLHLTDTQPQQLQISQQQRTPTTLASCRQSPVHPRLSSWTWTLVLKSNKEISVTELSSLAAMFVCFLFVFNPAVDFTYPGSDINELRSGHRNVAHTHDYTMPTFTGVNTVSFDMNCCEHSTVPYL